MHRKNKIVFILGAGFSNPAGIPAQKKILPEILKQASDPRFKNLLLSLYGHCKDIPLEDIFTALDKSITQNETLRRIDKNALIHIKDDFTQAIKRLLTNNYDKKNQNYLNKFSELLLKLRLKVIDTDSLAIISTNWDTLLEDALKSQMLKDWAKKDNERNAFIDYCTFTHSLDPSEAIPSPRLRALGYANLKLLKLHGSVGWHICPNCGSLFVDSKINGPLYNPDIHGCKICLSNHSFRIKTKPIIISPTFLKDFNNVHFRNIWWNAGFELSEATHIVFIGYSLPLSDFELRYMFARYIQKSHTKIRVILYSKNQSKSANYSLAAPKRYIEFFGKQINPNKDISFRGVKDYIRKLINGTEEFYW